MHKYIIRLSWSDGKTTCFEVEGRTDYDAFQRFCKKYGDPFKKNKTKL